MNSKHTPGPWLVDKYGHICTKITPAGETYSGSAVLFNGVSIGIGAEGREEATANKFLIAAAPEMLDALKALVKSNEMQGDSEEINHEALGALCEAVDMAIAAIAKAEGTPTEDPAQAQLPL